MLSARSTVILLFILAWWRSAGQIQEQPLRSDTLKNIIVSSLRLAETGPSGKILATDLRRSAQSSVIEAIGAMPGAHLITAGMGFRILNTRGFANTTNVRFMQLVDGMDIQSPHIGAPLGSVLMPIDLDIDRVDLFPGSATLRHGMNAINGMVALTTTDPFKKPGFSFRQVIGMNHPGAGLGARGSVEHAFRWACKINEKFAFKINGARTTGTDWVADDRSDLNPNGNSTTTLAGSLNPAADPVNGYGNESPNRRIMNLPGGTYQVARTGYYERDLTDYSLKILKADLSLHAEPVPGKRIIYTVRTAYFDNIYQRANRFRLKDYRLSQHALSFIGRSVQVRAFLNTENTGRSYNLRSMAENIDRSFKPDDAWFSDYAAAFKNGVSEGLSAGNAHQFARNAADAGRPVPGTRSFNNLLHNLSAINNWDVGAALRVRSAMVQGEILLLLTDHYLRGLRDRTGIELFAGADHRTHIIQPDGNYFINPFQAGRNLTYGRTGAFFQAKKVSSNGRLKAVATMRADKNEFFRVRLNQGMAIHYRAGQLSTLTVSLQTGSRFPAVFEAFSNVNSGGVKRLGGLPVMSGQVLEKAWNRASIDAFQQAILFSMNKQGIPRDEAIIRNKGLLVKNDYSFIRPEQVRSAEISFRRTSPAGFLKLEADAWFNRYRDFIAQVEINVPRTAVADSIPFYLADRKKQDRYRVWTNSKSIVNLFGASAGVQLDLLKKTRLSANVTFSGKNRGPSTDGLEDGFNTPAWMTNLAISKEGLFKNFGVSLSHRWQSSFYWQSFLVSGNVPGYQTVDGMINWRHGKLTLKLAGNNLLGRRYVSYLGGPSIGGFYHLSMTFNP